MTAEFTESVNEMAIWLDRGHNISATGGRLILRPEMLQKAVHNMSLWDAHSEEFVRQAQLYNKFDPFCDCIICAEDATSGELATLLILVGDAARLPSPPPTLALTSSHSPVLPPTPCPPLAVQVWGRMRWLRRRQSGLRQRRRPAAAAAVSCV